MNVKQLQKPAMATFLKDRREALMSLDKDVILAYAEKYGAQILQTYRDDDEMFWIIVHKTITAATDIPPEFRIKSEDWLIEQGYTPLGRVGEV